MIEYSSMYAPHQSILKWEDIGIDPGELLPGHTENVRQGHTKIHDEE